MSRTTMNWTALKSANASHLRRSVATMRVESFRLRREDLQLNRDKLFFASSTFTTASWIAMIQGMAKHYDQYCPVAHALDVVGDRWALLVVRELMQGPKRYTDLAEGLPGIGTNILAARLPELEAAGVAYTGPIDDPDVVVEGDAEGLYYLFIERRLDGVSISGDRALLDHLIDAAPQPIVA